MNVQAPLMLSICLVQVCVYSCQCIYFVDVEAFSDSLSTIYEQIHFSTDEEAWPLLQAKAFIPLVLSQYEG